METTTSSKELEPPRLGEPGEPCDQCGAPLAADQRYCLNCGLRRGEPRLPFERHLIGEVDVSQPPARPASGARRSSGEWSPMWAAAGLAALGVMLVIGVLLGKGSDEAPVVKVGGGVPATANTAAASGNGAPAPSTVAFKSDWPAGKNGYTVELGTLPKHGTTPEAIDAAKSDAESKGASGVGALDSDQYASLPGGNYILYSGVYGSKAEADKALAKLKGKFPDAKVVRVSDQAAAVQTGGGGGGGSVKHLTAGGGGSAPVKASKQDLQALQNASGAEYEQQAKKLDQPILTPGQQAAKDSKAPGAGSGAQVIK
jgi:SPOR domain